MSLSCVAVIPAYNEEGNITRVVSDWSRELGRLFGDSYRIIVIDDGSRDQTGALLDNLDKENTQLIVKHQQNQGHGAAVMHGYQLAAAMDTQTIFQTDSDDQFDAADFDKLWQRRAESKFILGFRRTRHDSVYRIALSKMAGFLVWGLFFVRLKDSNVPYRLMEKQFLQDALLLVPAGSFAPNICLSIIAAYKKQALLHIPVNHRKRMAGQSIVSKSLIRGCIRSFCDLLRLRAVV